MAVPFLQSIARAYAANGRDLSGHLFVFPSRRACTFFLKLLTQKNNDKNNYFHKQEKHQNNKFCQR